MAGVYWREAASLILVGRSHLISKHLQHQKSAKLVIEQDFNMLMLKRSSKSSFMPDALVFPGGAFDKTDLDPKWMNLFENYGFTRNDLKKLLRFHGPKHDFYSHAKDENILSELAYRICALRETFEESGLLLANKDKNAEEGGYVSLFPLEKNETEKWRSAVHNNPSEFIRLFEHIKAFPSVFGLFDWDAWLTPTVYGTLKNRFDTIFYIAFIDSEIPCSKQDGKEIQQIMIDGSRNIMKSFLTDEISVMPPQMYELSRVAKFLKFQDFHNFCKENLSSKNWSRIFPVSIKCKDGMVNVLSGDELYPETPNYYEDSKLKVDQTLNQLNSDSDQSFHRFIHDGKKFTKILIQNIVGEDSSVLLPFSTADLKKMLLT